MNQAVATAGCGSKGSPLFIAVASVSLPTATWVLTAVSESSLELCHIRRSSQNLITTWGHLVLAILAGTKSASSEFFHFIKNMSSPFESVAPRIFSGTKLRSKPLGCASFSFINKTYQHVVSHSSYQMVIFTCESTIFFFLFDVSCSSFRFGLLFSANLASNSSMSSGQSRFSTGSQVLSALLNK